MKFLRFLPIVAIACAAVSCTNGSSSLSEGSTQTDSLMYYLGQMHGADYLREANRDTTMKEASEKQAYIAGVRAGLAALKEGNEVYNRGVMMGFQMASQIMSFSEQQDVTIDPGVYVASLKSTLLADSMPNVQEAQMNMRKVMTNIQEAKEAKDKAASQETLKQAAEKDNLPKISDDLYGKTIEANNDTIAFSDRDEITLVSKATNLEGEPVNISLPAKGKLSNRRSYAEVVADAIKSLKNGETGEYLTTAHALLGARAAQMGMEPTEVIKLTLTPTLVPQEPKEEPKK